MEKTIVNDINITTYYHCKDDGEVVWVERVVSQFGDRVYSDIQSPTIYFKRKDRISEIENWLSEITHPKTEETREVIEAYREIVEKGRISFFTFFNLKVKVLKMRLYLGFLHFKNFLLGGVAP